MLSFNLYQMQTQKFMMTPELMQSIQILQFSSVELAAFLQEQANENPLIEIEWRSDSFINRRVRKRSLVQDDFDFMANIPAQDDTLETWVNNQLFMSPYPDEVRRAVSFLAGSLDDSGYLTIGLVEASEILGLPLKIAEKSLNILQSLDPPGIGARNLKECLLLQIYRDPNAPEVAAKIVEYYLEELARGKYQKIARGTGAAIAEVEFAARYIRRLNPRPCMTIGYFQTEHLVADAQVYVSSSEKQQIVMNENAIPKIRINEQYHRHMALQSEMNGEAQRYLREKLQSAQWLVRSVKHRNSTLQKVIHAIVEEQTDFFMSEKAGLKPLNLKIISQKTGFHESTISRAVRNKYIQTPRGIFELKFFFTHGFHTAEGRQISSRIVKKKISDLIAAENKLEPLSDQRIATILQKEGIPVSRRTIAKYREEERILPSPLRKHIYK